MTGPGFAFEARSAHQQMFAIRVEHVDVVAFRRTSWQRQARAHLLGEDKVPQLLSFANVLFIASPNHIKPSLVMPRGGIQQCAWMK